MTDSAEFSLIGSVLLNPSCLDRVREIVKAEDLMFPQSREIFLACCQENDEGREYDRTIIENVPGIDDAYIGKLVEITVTAACVERYALLVHERAVRTRIAGIGAELLELPEEESCSAAAEGAMDALSDVLSGSRSAVIDSENSLLQYYDWLVKRTSGALRPLSTGIPALDNFFGGGLEKGGLYILGARPGVGKSSLGMTIADYMAREHRVLYITLEMPPRQLDARRIAMHAGMSIGQACGLFRDDDSDKWAKIGEVTDMLAKHSLSYNTSAACTVSDVRLMARQQKSEVLVIDHLGLLQTETKFYSQYEKTTYISGKLKQLALTLDIPVVAMSQLNRSAAAGEPNLADLRDSGAIEQDADAVMLLHRPNSNEILGPREFQELDIILAKNRNGQTGKVQLEWNGATGRLRDDKNCWKSWAS